ncbi:MAG TPA: maltotransferase domain-containing protein, partial [bacterium]|nr:maltotransferase domain-containing protein [bacterium]
MTEDGRKRVIIENVNPEIDDGVFPVKRVAGESVEVRADIFADGHDQITAVVQYQQMEDEEWHEVPMTFSVNDRWAAEFTVDSVGMYRYTIAAWIDHLKTWQQDLKKKFDAGQDVTVDLQIGAQLIESAATRASGIDANLLADWSDRLDSPDSQPEVVSLALSDELSNLTRQFPDRTLETRYDKELLVSVDRKKALFSTWYEFFPRSAGEGTDHGTFRDAEALLPEIADMGFDVVYLPPVHPIGETNRKGKNNSVTAEPGDPGSPWAIGAKQGGHKAIHPELGDIK